MELLPALSLLAPYQPGKEKNEGSKAPLSKLFLNVDVALKIG